MTTTMNNKVAGTYMVDYVEELIIVSKKFLKAASIVGTKEFEIMAVLKKTYPTYEIQIKEISKKEDKVSYEGLSIEKMLAFISVRKEEKDVKEFERYIEVYTDDKTRKIKKGKYATIKKLFLEDYKEEFNSLSSKDMVDIDEKAETIKKEREEKYVRELKAVKEAELIALKEKVSKAA